MQANTHISRRLAAAALVTASLAIGVPMAHAATDGTLLTGASRQAAQVAKINPGHVTDGTLLTRASRQAALQQVVKVNPGHVTDGTLLTRASRQAVPQVAKVNPGRVTDGMLLTKAALVYELSQIDPGHGTGESIVSETAAARNAAITPVAQGGFDWGDAAAGFGVAAFAAALIAGAAYTVRRRGTLVPH